MTTNLTKSKLPVTNTIGSNCLKDFSKMSKKGNTDAVPMEAASEAAPKKGKQAIEDIYQKKTQLEHILLRPDTYIGSVEPVSEKMWVFEEGKMIHKEIKYVPGLYKIFDEILVNAADNKQRDPNMDTIKIDIDQENNSISIYNNGQGIPIVEHKDEKMFVPTMIFGHLLTSSNFNDEEKKVTGGRNGYGAKLCNVFSTKFSLETANRKNSKLFKQTWEHNMTKQHPHKILDRSGDDYTKVTFKPDLGKFKMESLDNDIVALFQRRAYDVAGTTIGVRVFLNGKRIPIKNFKEYVELFLKDLTDETDKPIKYVHEKVNERWEIAICPSEDNFRQISFVNSIATSKGGRHVDYIADIIAKHLVEGANKKNKGGILIKPAQIRNHLWIFVNCLIENPTFDSQTKESMTLQMRLFGSKCQPSEKFFTAVLKSGIIESVLSWAKFKQDQQKDKTGGRKINTIKGIPKLEDANDAGTRHSLECTLILTEGDSAKTLAVAGLGVIGRDKYGVFPLRGKLLNVREASHKQIMENAEINAMVKILGLKYKQKYDSQDDMKTLRYGKLMIMTDQDHDGSHIKGLIINFIHHNWPSLLRRNFMEEFITPIVKVSKGNEVISFYSLPELEEWKKSKPNWKTYKIKYYKGLGTSTSVEAKEYFLNIERHRIKFHYNGTSDDDQITMAFSKKCVEQRKDWLNNWMDNCKRRKELGLSQDIIYGQNVRTITYGEFVNKELVLFSNLDNERSIPCLVDGLKPGQRKVIYTCFKRNYKKEIKVAQLAGSVAEHSAYHHGEVSLMSTIVNLAQNYIGSNNINLLEPNGQFGTRLQGGKDSASPRYIFTMLSQLTRLIFNKSDEPLLRNQFDDNLKIEPEWYCPIIPMILVNGADGIGTGWMTRVPNFNPRDIVKNLQKLIRGEEPEQMHPWYKNFRGEIIEITPQKYATYGEVAILSDEDIEITELPIGTWTQTYKESVIEPMVNGTDKIQPVLTGYKEYNTDTTVRFILSGKPNTMRQFEKEGFHKSLKLQSMLSLTSMVLFDKNGCLKRYESAIDILKEFFELRMNLYEKRRDYMIGELTSQYLKFSNQARFIMEKCDGDITIENKKKRIMIQELVTKKYDSDPVKSWINRQKSLQEQEHDAEEQAAGEESQEEEPEEEQDFDYILGMKLWSLTLERKQEILKQRDEKQKALDILQKKTPADLYDEDLKAFSEKLDEVEEAEREEEASTVKVEKKKDVKGKVKGRAAAVKNQGMMETCPSPIGERVRPVFDELLKKAELAAQVKTKREKKTKVKKEDKDEFDLLADDKDTLLDKINSSNEGKKITKRTIGRKKNGSTDGLKQTKLNFGKAAPKRKKRSGSSSGDDFSESDDDFSPKPKKIKASSDSDSLTETSSSKIDSSALFDSLIEKKKHEDSDIMEVEEPKVAQRKKPIAYDINSDSDSQTKKTNKKPAPAKKSVATSKVSKPKAKVPGSPKKNSGKNKVKNGWNSDSDESVDFSSKNKKKGKKNVVSSDDSDYEFEPSSPVKTEGAGRQPRRAAARPTNYILDSGEEED